MISGEKERLQVYAMEATEKPPEDKEASGEELATEVEDNAGAGSELALEVEANAGASSEESDIVHDSEIALQQPIELEEENQKGQLAEAEQPKQGKSTVAYEESDYPTIDMCEVGGFLGYGQFS